ncbi:MAG: glycosyltransferase family 2 protein [Actinomycetota bacterium]|nr:glycosyltransferase family 2 protein [Actinomycetota bacterium]
MAGTVKRLGSRLDAWDALSSLLVLLFLVLVLANHSLYPVFLDAPYHMAVTRGFREAGGVTTWDFWDYAPEGRPHLYPPLLHVAMSFLEDLGLSLEATVTLVCMAMFPLIMLSLWWAMRGLFGSRMAFFSLLLLVVPGVFLWQTGVTIAASLVLVISPLVLLAMERERTVTAVVLLAMSLYSHLVLGHLLALALLIYLLHRRKAWRRILAVLGVAYLLYLPWALVILGNLHALSFSGPGGGGGVAIHLTVWALAVAGMVYCYRRKGSWYLLPSYFLSMVPIAFFYPHRFWQGHVFLPLAMLGAVALDALHEAGRGWLERGVNSPAWSSALWTAVSCSLLLPLLLVDPVLSWGSRTASAPRPPVPGSGTTFPAAPAVPGGRGAPAAGSLSPRTQAFSAGGASSSLQLELQPTSLTALAGLDELRMPAGGTRTFGPENMELVWLVEEWSEPGDLVFVTNGILGDFIYAMTGRYATRGMFHEVRPEVGEAAPDQADLAVISAPVLTGMLFGWTSAGTPFSRRGWSAVGGAGPHLVLKRNAKRVEDKEVKDMGTVIPMWMAYMLAALAAVVILVDVLVGRPFRGEKGGGGDHHDLPAEPRESGGRGEVRALVMVPARDEEGNVGKVVSEVRETCPGLDVLVLDDGSTDRTAVEARRAGAMVLRSERKLGLGEMMRLGMAYALQRGYRAAVRVDGDGQHAAEYIPSLLWPVLKGNADVVVGSRFMERGGYEGRITLPRRVGMAYFRFLLRLWVRRDFSDPTSGFRSYSRRAMSLLVERKPARYPEVSELCLSSLRGLDIAEAPVRMRRRHNGRSSLGLKGVLSMFWGATLTFFHSGWGTPGSGRREPTFLPVRTAGTGK